MSRKALVDLDIILDLLTMRGVFYHPAAELFTQGYNGRVELFATSVMAANVFYILRKKYDIEKSKGLLKKLRVCVHVLSVTEQNVDDVLDSSFGDFEDALQYFAAKESGVPVIITRNIKDYKSQDIQIQSAAEYLAAGKT